MLGGGSPLSMPEMNPLPILPHHGDLIEGRYLVVCVLGVGGMGIVCSAVRVGSDERVAIKMLRPELLAQRDAMARFSNEARAAAKIESEHVAQVIDVGTLENGLPFMVMEYL